MSKVTSEDVLSFYRGVLDSLNVLVEDNGLLSLKVDDDQMPMPLSIKRSDDSSGRLVLPTKEALDNPSDDLIFFHPLSENTLRGESAVLRKLKYLIIYRVNSIVIPLLTTLIDIVANVDIHSELTPKQKYVLTLIEKADDRTIKDLTKIIKNSGLKASNSFIYLFLKRGGKVDGAQCSRICKVTTPILKSIDHEERVINGVSVRKADIDGLEHLIDYVSLWGDDFSTGTSSLTVPSLEALLKTYVKIAGHLNRISYHFRKYIPNYKSLRINLDWVDYLGSLEVLTAPIPPLEWNKGTIGGDEKESNLGNSPTTEALNTGQSVVKDMFKEVDDVHATTDAPTQPSDKFQQNALSGAHATPTFNAPTPQEEEMQRPTNSKAFNVPQSPTEPVDNTADEGEGIDLHSIIPPSPPGWGQAPPQAPVGRNVPQFDSMGRPLDQWGNPVPPRPPQQGQPWVSPQQPRNAPTPPPVDQWGRPVDQYGNVLPTVQQPPPQQNWNQARNAPPQQPQPQQNWNQPSNQPPQTDPWGRPVDQWGRPLAQPTPPQTPNGRGW